MASGSHCTASRRDWLTSDADSEHLGDRRFHTNFPGAKLGHNRVANGVEQQSTAFNGNGFPARFLFSQVESACKPHWQ